MGHSQQKAIYHSTCVSGMSLICISGLGMQTLKMCFFYFLVWDHLFHFSLPHFSVKKTVFESGYQFILLAILVAQLALRQCVLQNGGGGGGIHL